MTYSNGSFNPHPLANPFNTRLGFANYSLNPNSISYRHQTIKFDKNAQLPNSEQFDIEQNDIKLPDTTPRISLKDMMTLSQQYSRNMSWNNYNIYHEMFSELSRDNRKISKIEQDYWNKAKKESEKLLSSMTDEQKQLLAELSANGFFDSKLEDDDTN